MTIKMVALRKFYYPYGGAGIGRDYQVGDEVDVRTQREADTLALIRKAKLAPVETLAVPKPRAVKLESTKAEEVKPFEKSTTYGEEQERHSRPVAPMSTADVDTSEKFSRRKKSSESGEE